MPTDETRRDASPPVATGRDSRFSLSIEDAADAYARAGHPRTLRSIQRYCANGHLESIKVATTLGDKYFIDATSLTRHIAQIDELALLDARTTGRDLSRQVATDVAAPIMDDRPRQAATGSDVLAPVTAIDASSQPRTRSDTPRPVATEEPAVSPPVAASPTDTEDVARLKREVEQKTTEIAFLREQSQDEREFLREQIDRKDRTIDALIERDRETNFLVRGLQEMLTPLLGGPRRPEPDRGADHRVD